MTARIRDEYFVDLKGKPHPTYPGILIALHESGVLGIEVNVLQYPSAENQETAVCQATITMPGTDGRERIFTDVGDANPANTGSHIAVHLIRMASTRAKGRAGRDALALGVALFEELGPDAHETNGHAVPRAKHDPQDHAERTGASVCQWPDCGVIVEGQQARISVEHHEKILCPDHDAQLTVTRRKKAEKLTAKTAA